MGSSKLTGICALGLFAGLALCSAAAQVPAVPVSAGPEPAAEEAPPRPKLPAELPPAPPKVTCKGDQLSITANNATIGSILEAVHGCVGVQIDVPDGASGMRAYGDFGPGPAVEVLTSFLASTDFDYILGTSEAHPEKLQTVLLMERDKDKKGGAGDSSTNVAMSAGRRVWLEAHRGVRGSQAAAVEDSSTAADTGSTNSTEPAGAAPESAPVEQAQAPVVPADPPPPQPTSDLPIAPVPGVPFQPGPGANLSGDPNSSPAQGKSTEQLINEMQQLIEQRKQLNQNQNQNLNGTTPKP